LSKMGHGYGSEFQLLRWMGRHRRAFNDAVLAALGKNSGEVEWEDFHFKPGTEVADGERKGLDFLPDGRLQTAWKEFWPQRAGIHNWDAVGWWCDGDHRELILVEAKANTSELESSCQAKPEGGLAQIEEALKEAAGELSSVDYRDWLSGYYQYANRLAASYFLHKHGVPAHLLLVYFAGDRSESGLEFPQSPEEWREVLEAQEEHIGLRAGHQLEAWVHKLFLAVDSGRFSVGTRGREKGNAAQGHGK
jgi:hypothetical protein